MFQAEAQKHNVLDHFFSKCGIRNKGALGACWGPLFGVPFIWVPILIYAGPIWHPFGGRVDPIGQ